MTAPARAQANTEGDDAHHIQRLGITLHASSNSRISPPSCQGNEGGEHAVKKKLSFTYNTLIWLCLIRDPEQIHSGVIRRVSTSPTAI